MEKVLLTTIWKKKLLSSYKCLAHSRHLKLAPFFLILSINQLIYESSVFRSAQPPLKSRALIPKLTIHTQQQGKLKEFSCHMQASFVVMVDE